MLYNSETVWHLFPVFSLSFPDYQVKVLVGVKDRILNIINFLETWLTTRLLDKLYSSNFFFYRRIHSLCIQEEAVVVSCFKDRSFTWL